ncbi:MAG: hypothetical protein ACKOWP_02250 [Microbacteriaceae bacterium]
MTQRIELALHDSDNAGVRSETLPDGSVRVFVTPATTTQQLGEYLATVHPELESDGHALWADDSLARDFIPENGFIAIRPAVSDPRP